MLGPPGSGKGTVSEKLAKDFNLNHISSGELFRENIKGETELGKKAQEYIQQGLLVPDEVTIGMVKDKLSKDDFSDNFILDGFPRTLYQAQAIEEIEIDMAIYLEVPEEVVVERFAGRRACPKCKAGYHIKYLPPEQEGICNEFGTELIQRKDDVPEVIKERFKVYYEKTKPLIDYYQEKGILKTVDGAPAPDVVYSGVKEVIKTNS